MTDQVGGAIHAHVLGEGEFRQDHRHHREREGEQHLRRQQCPPTPQLEQRGSQHQDNQVFGIDLEGREAAAVDIGVGKHAVADRTHEQHGAQPECDVGHPHSQPAMEEQRRGEHSQRLQVTRSDPELRRRVGAVPGQKAHALERQHVAEVDDGAPADDNRHVDQEIVLLPALRHGRHQQRGQGNDNGEQLRRDVEHQVADPQAQGADG